MEAQIRVEELSGELIEESIMEAIFAGVAFIGLFSLWVLLPKKLLKR